MLDPKDFLKATLEAGRELLRSSNNTQPESVGRPTIVPIRSLGENHRARIADHLFQLSEQDRYLRFGYIAKDDQIRKYVEALDFYKDEIFGVYNRRLELVAVAHLAYGANASDKSAAEFGVSVLERARGKGLGARLFERAAMHATNDGVGLLYIHALSDNTAMLTIARNVGATVERNGSESEAYLRLPMPTIESRVNELIKEHIAQTDYHIKTQAKLFWQLMADLQIAGEDDKADMSEPETTSNK